MNVERILRLIDLGWLVGGVLMVWLVYLGDMSVLGGMVTGAGYSVAYWHVFLLSLDVA